MSLFSAVLQGLQKKTEAQNAYKQTVIECVHTVVGVTITPDSIVSFKDGTLILALNPTSKMALNLKKDTVLEALREKGVGVSVIK